VVGGSGLASAEATINVTTQLTPGAFNPGNPLMFDGFDYAVGRTEANSTAQPTFISGAAPAGSPARVAGWAGCKRLPTDTSSYGYLYTVTQAEMQVTTGYTGPLPGAGARCLKMEVPAGTPQTDFYLNHGAIPGNVWFQFWLYSPNYGSETANMVGRHKFIYPSNNAYPSSTCKWLFITSDWTAKPYEAQPFGSPTNGRLCFNSRDNVVGTVNYSVGDPSNASKLGPNLGTASDGFIAANQWTLVKVHYDTSNNASGVFEMWLRPYGGAWRKIAEWIGGVTPNFTWSGFGAGGHATFLMPSTIHGNNAPNDRGAQYYMDDFAIAASEADLPTYG